MSLMKARIIKEIFMLKRIDRSWVVNSFEKWEEQHFYNHYRNLARLASWLIHQKMIRSEGCERSILIISFLHGLTNFNMLH